MIGQKGVWELMLQNPKLNKSYCSSFALNVGNKNYALVVKNRFSKRDYGKVNVELSIQVICLFDCYRMRLRTLNWIRSTLESVPISTYDCVILYNTYRDYYFFRICLRQLSLLRSICD